MEASKSITRAVRRRGFLAGTAMLLFSATTVRAATIAGQLPWKPGSADPPAAVSPGGWHYFTPQEAATVEAFVDRLIPPRSANAGRQGLRLRGVHRPPARRSLRPLRRLLHERPVPGGNEAAGPAIAGYARAAISQGAGRARRRLPRQIRRQGFRRSFRRAEGRVIKGLEDGSLKLDGTDGQNFFKLILKDTQNGFLADPIYGGNKDMASGR